MNAPIFVTPPPVVPLPDAPAQQQPVPIVPQLLHKLVELQTEQVGLIKTQLANQDSGSRWRAFLARWAEEFPGIGLACKQAAPILERAYLALLRELTERVNSGEAGDLENEYVLSDFLDRYAIRLGQLSNILGQVGPLADATPAPKPEASSGE